MNHEHQPIGFLFESIAYNSPENVEDLIDGMTLEQSYYIITQASHQAHSKGVYSLQESEVLSKALRIIKNTITEK